MRPREGAGVLKRGRGLLGLPLNLTHLKGKKNRFTLLNEAKSTFLPEFRMLIYTASCFES